MFGVDWNGPLPSSSTNCVIVEPPPSPLSQQDFRQLCHYLIPAKTMEFSCFLIVLTLLVLEFSNLATY